MVSSLIYEHDHKGEEFDWVAVDDEGRVGFFASGGLGPVPQRSVEAANDLLDIQGQICALPRFCEATCVANVEYYIGDFMEIAARGLYSYNWDFYQLAYRLIAEPRAAIEPRYAGKVAVLAQQVHLLISFDQAGWIPSSIEVRV